MLRTVKNQMLIAYRAGATTIKMTSTHSLSQTNQLVMNSIIGVPHARNFSTDNSNPPKTDDPVAPKKRKPRTPKAAKQAEAELDSVRFNSLKKIA